MPYEIKVEAAPSGESLERIKSRLILLVMKRQANAGEPSKEINAVVDLRERSLQGNEPTEAEWKSARNDLADRADLADLADRTYLAYRADLADLADRADRAYRADLVSDLVTLLDNRLTAIKALDAQILAAIEIKEQFSLDMGAYHSSCGTAHCRAGSAIILHPLGRDLEAVFGPWLAGAVIYQKSTGRVPDFFASNEAAMTDIRKCAAEQEALE